MLTIFLGSVHFMTVLFITNNHYTAFENIFVIIHNNGARENSIDFPVFLNYACPAYRPWKVFHVDSAQNPNAATTAVGDLPMTELLNVSQVTDSRTLVRLLRILWVQRELATVELMLLAAKENEEVIQARAMLQQIIDRTPTEIHLSGLNGERVVQAMNHLITLQWGDEDLLEVCQLLTAARAVLDEQIAVIVGSIEVPPVESRPFVPVTGC